jgi:hypothetical protein
LRIFGELLGVRRAKGSGFLHGNNGPEGWLRQEHLPKGVLDKFEFLAFWAKHDFSFEQWEEVGKRGGDFGG